MYKPYLALFGVSLLTAAAQIMIKKGALLLDTERGFKYLFFSFFTAPMILGLFFTLTAPLLYFYALRTVPLGRAYLLSSLNYIFILLGCRFVLRERIRIYHSLGVLLILGGIILSNW